MRVLVFLITATCLLGCSSSKSSIHVTNANSVQSVSLDAAMMVINADSRWIGEDASDYLEQGINVDSLGSILVQKIMVGYKNQTTEFEYEEFDDEADILVRVTKLNIKNGNFTFDITHPGPMFYLKMDVDAIQNGKLQFSRSYKTTENLSQIAFSDTRWHWMNRTGKRNSGYQKMMVEQACRHLYQTLYFNLLDITLEL